MNYKYPPIYKYILLLILMTTFLKYYSSIKKNEFMIITTIFLYMMFVLDYMFINEHPSLLTETPNKKKKVDKLIKTISNKEIKIDDTESSLSDDLTEEIQKELDELDL